MARSGGAGHVGNLGSKTGKFMGRKKKKKKAQNQLSWLANKAQAVSIKLGKKLCKAPYLSVNTNLSVNAIQLFFEEIFPFCPENVLITPSDFRIKIKM